MPPSVTETMAKMAAYTRRYVPKERFFNRTVRASEGGGKVFRHTREPINDKKVGAYIQSALIAPGQAVRD